MPPDDPECTPDADAIVQTIRHPLLVLGGDLRVKSANAAFYDTFRVSVRDTIGRLIYELGNGQWSIPQLRKLLQGVLPHDQRVVDFSVEHDFEEIGWRAMLLNARSIAREGRPDRILLAIEDITERKCRENELTAQKEFSDKVVDAVREPLLIMDWDLRVRSANASFYEIFRVEREQTEGRFVYELGNGQWDIPQFRELLEDVLPENDAFDDYEVEHVFPDLGRRIMLLNARRIDHVKLILLAIEDVTERRTAERRKEFILGMNDAVQELDDPQAVLELVTRSVAEHLEISRASYGEFDEARQHVQILQRHSPGEPGGGGSFPLEQFTLEMVAELKSGRPVVARDVREDSRTSPSPEIFEAADVRAVLCVPVVDDNQLQAFLALADREPRNWSEEDVTLAEQLALRAWSTVERIRSQRKLQQSELRYRTLFESIDEGFCLVEVLFDDSGKPVDYRFLEVNPAFEKHTGIRDAVGRRMRAIAPDHETAWFDMYGRVARSGQAVRFQAPAEALGRYYDVYAFRPTDSESHQVALLFTDITERRLSEEALRESEEHLRKLNETLEQRVAERSALAERRAEQLRALAIELTRTEQRERRYLAGILHDHLQQQLVAAKMHAGIVQHDLRDESQQRILEQVMDLMDEAIATTRSLSVELSPPVLYERGLAAGLEWLAGQMQQQYGLAVHVTTDPQADPPEDELCELLFHAVRELLLNIVKHANTDRAWLRMTRRRGRIRLEVSDEGGGFDPSELEVSRTFGLFHIRERLAPIGGRMTITSAPGKGTRIMINAPHDLAGGVDENQAEASLAGGARRNGSSKTRILLVDDHRIIREGLVALLERQPDLDVIGEAGDGQTAVEITRDLEPDVVIMDVNMPGMNGIAATQHITVAMPDVRVIGLSLHGEDAMGRAMIDAGASAYLTKGGPSHELIETIREVVARD